MHEPRSIHPGHAWRDLKTHSLPLLVLGYTAVALALTEYVFLSGHFAKLFPQVAREYAPGVVYGSWAAVPAGREAPWWGVLLPWAWWIGGMLVLWVALPAALAVKFKFRPAELGLRTKGVLPKLWVYGVLYLVVMIGVLWAGTQEGFTRMYPMIKPWYCERWTWAVLLSWWALYALQFFAVEFFFRGWMLFTLEKELGMAAVAVMIVPYCMIHFHKPLPEALGAVVAGMVLGWIALRTRSIWGGWLVHVAIAISMDVLSLLKSDYGLPKVFGP